MLTLTTHYGVQTYISYGLPLMIIFLALGIWASLSRLSALAFLIGTAVFLSWWPAFNEIREGSNGGKIWAYSYVFVSFILIWLLSEASAAPITQWHLPKTQRDRRRAGGRLILATMCAEFFAGSILFWLVVFRNS